MGMSYLRLRIITKCAARVCGPSCSWARSRAARVPAGAPRAYRGPAPPRAINIFNLFLYSPPRRPYGGRRDGLVRAGSSDSEGAAAVQAVTAASACTAQLSSVPVGHRPAARPGERGRSGAWSGGGGGARRGCASRLRVAAAAPRPHAQANGPHETTPRTMQPIPCRHNTLHTHTHTHTHTLTRV